ncbi:hypothetical protein TNCV_613601 [Trichonephila clavipes]|nr:hypothetical protein TNCV_613601 [Trichonephila clavipes]
MTIRSVRSFTLATDVEVSHTSDFMWLQKWKSMGLRPEERGGQTTGVPRLVYILGYVTGKWLRTAIKKCSGALSCMNHTFRGVVAGTSCSNSGSRAGSCSFAAPDKNGKWPPLSLKQKVTIKKVVKLE